MQTIPRYLIPLIAGVAAAFHSAPAAQPDDSSTLPACTDVGGPTALGAGTTE
jgi:hypothetical protein